MSRKDAAIRSWTNEADRAAKGGRITQWRGKSRKEVKKCCKMLQNVAFQHPRGGGVPRPFHPLAVPRLRDVPLNPTTNSLTSPYCTSHATGGYTERPEPSCLTRCVSTTYINSQQMHHERKLEGGAIRRLPSPPGPSPGRRGEQYAFIPAPTPFPPTPPRSSGGGDRASSDSPDCARPLGSGTRPAVWPNAANRAARRLSASSGIYRERLEVPAARMRDVPRAAADRAARPGIDRRRTPAACGRRSSDAGRTAAARPDSARRPRTRPRVPVGMQRHAAAVAGDDVPPARSCPRTLTSSRSTEEST